eukprot:3941214-Rhodomonas_salina.1
MPGTDIALRGTDIAGYAMPESAVPGTGIAAMRGTEIAMRGTEIVMCSTEIAMRGTEIAMC